MAGDNSRSTNRVLLEIGNLKTSFFDCLPLSQGLQLASKMVGCL